jgi:L-ascorbate metabolism protein UlaG (beta-lactamase superfamily)
VTWQADCCSLKGKERVKRGTDLIENITSCRVQKGTLAFWWLGQLGYVLKCLDTVIVIDAFLSDHPGRKVPPLLRPEELTVADYVLGTHNHEDHIDKKTWNKISRSSPRAKFVVPGLLADALSRDLDIPPERLVGLDDSTSFVKQGLKITGVAAAHEFLDRDQETGMYPYLGYVIEIGGCAIYHSGDCCIYEGLSTKLKEHGKLDVMCLPINGRDGKRYRQGCIGNMTFQEAADLAGLIGPRLVVPGHYEMFDNNLGDPIAFAEYMEAKYPAIGFWIGGHGEKVLVECSR